MTMFNVHVMLVIKIADKTFLVVMIVIMFELVLGIHERIEITIHNFEDIREFILWHSILNGLFLLRCVSRGFRCLCRSSNSNVMVCRFRGVINWLMWLLVHWLGLNMRLVMMIMTWVHRLRVNRFRLDMRLMVIMTRVHRLRLNMRLVMIVTREHRLRLDMLMLVSRLRVNVNWLGVYMNRLGVSVNRLWHMHGLNVNRDRFVMDMNRLSRYVMVIRLVHFNSIDRIRWSMNHNWGNVLLNLAMRVSWVIVIVLGVNVNWLGHVHWLRVNMDGLRVHVNRLWHMHWLRVNMDGLGVNVNWLWHMHGLRVNMDGLGMYVNRFGMCIHRLWMNVNWLWHMHGLRVYMNRFGVNVNW